MMEPAAMSIENSMDDFEQRVARIHGLGTHAQIGVPMVDTQIQELRAMFASFLGEDYDKEKILRVEAFQSHLRNAQAYLARQLEQWVFRSIVTGHSG